jgi:short-subunit dehydrogenase
MLKLKKAIVIGATSGLGRCLAGMLVKDKYLVGITGRRRQLLEEIKKEAPGSYLIKAFDVADTKNSVKNIEELVARLGGLDLLIISAGTGDLNAELDFEIEKNTIETNVLGFCAITDWALKFFEKQKNGHLAAITSIAGERGSRSAPAYNASKAFQISYMEAMRQRVHHSKLPIYITDIRPGLVNTPMAKGDGQFWVAPVEKASKQIYDAIKKKKKVAYVTKRWAWVAAILKLMPDKVYERL